MLVNTAARAVVRSPGKAAPLGVLCLRVSAFTRDEYWVSFGESTGFGANSNQGQIVTNIGYYLGLFVTNSNDSLIVLPKPN